MWFILCPVGFSKASLSLDASEELDGYSSAEEPSNSDPEDEVKKLVGHQGQVLWCQFYFFIPPPLFLIQFGKQTNVVNV